MRRKNLNIALLVLNLVLIGVAVWIARQPAPSVPAPHEAALLPGTDMATSVSGLQADEHALTRLPDSGLQADERPQAPEQPQAPASSNPQASMSTNPQASVSSAPLPEVRTRALTAAGNPFRHEAVKVLSGKLEESDSTSRTKILNYCEHLRRIFVLNLEFK